MQRPVPIADDRSAPATAPGRSSRTYRREAGAPHELRPGGAQGTTRGAQGTTPGAQGTTPGAQGAGRARNIGYIIALFTRDERSRFGLEAALGIEKIAHRRVDSLDGLDAAGFDLLVVAASDLTAAESRTIAAFPSVVINGGRRFAGTVFGAGDLRLRAAACRVDVDSRVWSKPAVELVRSFAQDDLRVPWTEVAEADVDLGVEADRVRAWMSTDEDSARRPAVVVNGTCTWMLFDPGRALYHLLSESYGATDRTPRPATRLRTWLESVKHRVYYAMPDVVRRAVRRRLYALLGDRTAVLPDDASRYPVDATGWLLVELIKQTCLRRTARPLVRLARWPAPYSSAATLTHDIEPTRFAYTTGIDRLLDRAEGLGATGSAREPDLAEPTFGIVARTADRRLRGERLARVARHRVLCHGLAHVGESAFGDAEQTETQVRAARDTLERALGRRVRGYRSPRLDRSEHLARALDAVGLEYDSSWPDVDRENMQHFGAGVRLNVPFRPPVRREETAARESISRSRCLELPLTAPDCIQPLFAGGNEASLAETIREKARFVAASEGLYVALVHAGVFGPDDADLRGRLLDHVVDVLSTDGVWFARMDAIARWWSSRESVHVTEVAGKALVANAGEHAIEGMRLVVETEHGQQVVELPRLEPGARIAVGLPGVAGSLERYGT